MPLGETLKALSEQTCAAQALTGERSRRCSGPARRRCRRYGRLLRDGERARGTKVYSTVARLAGTWRATAKLTSQSLLNTCVRQMGGAYDYALIYAETLLENVLEEDAWGGGVVSTADRKVLKAIAALNDRDNPFKDLLRLRRGLPRACPPP